MLMLIHESINQEKQYFPFLTYPLLWCNSREMTNPHKQCGREGLETLYG